MNKRFHRVVWNAARKLKVVVQETARAAGKASGATALVSAVALMAGWPVQAQIAGAPGVAPGLRPTVLVAPNGVPLVNIQTPSAAGVSRNLYQQFDVQRNGVILNNSRTDVQTQLAAQAGAAAGGSAALATGEGVALTGGGVFLGASAPITAGVSAAVKVGITALASRAAVSLVNNDGDLGRVLQEMGRSESVKAIATSMLTAGVIEGLGNTITMDVDGVATPLNQITPRAGFMPREMKLGRANGLKAFGQLFCAWLFITTVGFSLGALLAMPLLRWAIHGVLYFPTSVPELVRLAWVVIGVTLVATLLMWLEGKWNGRW